MDLSMIFQITVACAVAAVTGAVGWLIRTVSANQRNSDEHATRLGAAISDIGDLKAMAREHDRAIVELRTRVTDIKAFDSKISEVNRRIDEINSQGARIEGEVSALNRAVQSFIDAAVNRDGTKEDK